MIKTSIFKVQSYVSSSELSEIDCLKSTFCVYQLDNKSFRLSDWAVTKKIPTKVLLFFFLFKKTHEFISHLRVTTLINAAKRLTEN